MKYKYLNKNFIMSTFKPKEDETIIIHFDQDNFYPEETQHLMKLMKKMFPKNNIVITLKGVDLTTEKFDK